MGRKILNDASRTNVEKRGFASVELKPISNVMASFIQIMKHDIKAPNIKNYKIDTLPTDQGWGNINTGECSMENLEQKNSSGDGGGTDSSSLLILDVTAAFFSL
ncbi:unnamed protein product [Fraxinus pennsylvanica]|uniref:Uncharacterized protein n=1 Tax=Fraxinus pennsylvanica TaxID=56036 RepID=A0AAD2A5G3_9LAMI|nr:unnamed protein product [Fraxinus pennsylvanica]